MSASDNHNQLTKEVVGLLGNRTKTMAEMMVVTESVILAVLLLLVRLYGQKPSAASVLMETALQRATERFSKKQR